MVAQYYIRTSS